MLETYLAAHADDQEARWFYLHARYAQHVRGGTLQAADAAAFRAQARIYIDANAANSALAREWLAAF